MKVGLYVRVSTVEQKKYGLSVDNQVEALKDYCRQKKYEIVEIYNDAGRSAHVSYLKRPALIKMMKDCQENKIELLLFTKLDRFFRSVEDYYDCIDGMNNVPWQAIWEDYETVTSAGRFKVNIMLSIAQAEAERTSERIKNTFEYKRAKGDYVGTAPFGYVRSNNRLVKDPNTKAYAEMVFKTYIKTFSIDKTAAVLNEAGCSITRSGVCVMLKNKTYTGDAYGTKCEPYISIEEYERIQDIKSRNYRAPSKTHSYLFLRLLYCGKCGYPMRGLAVPYKGGYYYQYQCQPRCNQLKYHNNYIGVSEKKVEKYLLKELDNIIEKHNLQLAAVPKDDNEIEKQRQKLKKQLERLGIRFELGDYTVEEYKEKRQQLQNEIAALPVSISRSTPVSLPDNWRTMYEALDREHKATFWRGVIERIIVHDTKPRTYDIVFL